MKLSKHRAFWEFFAGCAFGAALFLSLYGFGVLDPSNFDWCLLENNDTGQHFIGSWAFLREPWHWPPGIFRGLSHPDPASISIIDGIPLAALTVKLFRGARPEPFQYLGWWGLVCFCLQGGFAALLMRKFAKRAFFRMAGVFFLVVSVPFLTRYPLHTALSSHFLILWALYLMLCKWNVRTATAWTALLVLSLAIHPYLTGMCLPLYAGVTIQEFWRRGRGREFRAASRILLNWGVTLLAALTALYLLGIFGIGVRGGGCFGQTQINLNSPFNPVEWNVSSFVAPMPVLPFVENIYFGVGLLLLTLAALPELRRLFRRDPSLWHRHGLPVAFLLAMVLFAVNCRVSLGRTVLVQILLPPWLQSLGGVFRSAGRFAWPAWYLFAAWAVGVAARKRPRLLGVGLTAAAVLLQIFDLGGGLVASIWSRNFTRRDVKYVSPYEAVALPGSVKHLAHTSTDEDFCDVGYFALKHGLVLEDYYFARGFGSRSGRAAMEKLLNTGELAADTVYLLRPDERVLIGKRHPHLRNDIVPTSGRSVLFRGGGAESTE